MICTFDFETEAIEPRPDYPPRPVGVAIKKGSEKSRYYAFGHPDKNNCDEATARAALAEVWGEVLLAHHAKFDYDVALTHWGLPEKPWDQIHDTTYLLYLDDPHAESFSLKPSAERYLGEPPTEQDAVRQWLIDHKIVTRTSKKWGAHIAKAPGDLVGRYAIGDVERTYKLFRLLHPKIKKHGMLQAYDRERRLMPILLKNEQEGIHCDVQQLEQDIERYQGALVRAEKWIRKYLKAPGLNLDADRELAAALEGHVKQWSYTETGQKSVSKVSLKPEHFKDQKLASVYGYSVRLKTCLNTFACPWYELAQKNGGRLCTSWNQTRGDRGGTRTGRLSSSTPLNLQNIPKSFNDKPDGYVHPSFLKVPELPLLRQYILPDEGHAILHRDFASQELRILAHYEDGSLLKAYQDNTNLDVHQFARDEIQKIAGLKLERRAVKIAVFTGLYSGGLNKLAEQLGSTVEHAQAVRDALRTVMPDVVSLERGLKATWRKGEPIRTWGGRLYHCEPPSNGRTYDYRALNVLIQSSAADVTKQALINYERAKQHGRLQTCVHDELNLSVPIEHIHTEMAILCEAMEKIPMDVPMKTEGKMSVTNWGELAAYEEFAN